MASQSGIQPNEELQVAWTAALSSATEPRVLKVSIANEQLVSSASISPSSDFNSDFDLIPSLLEPDTPCYIIYRLDSPSSSSPSFVLYSYVPDTSPVRAKMLYASTRSTLLRFLTPSKLATTIHASLPEEMGLKAYEAHLRHLGADKPRTEREEEIERLKALEETTADQGREENPLFGEGKGRSGWTEEAVEAVRAFAGGSVGAAVRLEIDSKESVALSSPQPTGLQLRTDAPSYTFYRHPRGPVFIYCCPSLSKIKSRMLHSSAARGCVHVAESLDVKVLKRLETSEPEEVTDAWIEDALGPAAQVAGAVGETGVEKGVGGLSLEGGEGAKTPSSGMMTPTAPLDKPESVGFSKPARPGRKR